MNHTFAKRTFSKTLALLALFSTLLACAKAPPRSALDAATATTLQQELDAYTQRQAALPGLSAFVQVKLSARGKSELFDAALLAQPPDKLFLQILDDLGQERARVVADGARVLFYDAQENRHELMPQNEAALNKLLRLPLGVEELIDRLMIRFPATEALGWEERISSDAPQVAYWARRNHDRLGLTQRPLRLAVYEALNASGKWDYRVEYPDGEMHWSFRKPKIRLSLKFQEIEYGKNLPAGRFDTEAPSGSAPRD